MTNDTVTVTVNPSATQTILYAEVLQVVASASSNSAGASFSYQWREDGGNITTNGTSATLKYIPSSIAVHAVNCLVTSNSGGTSSAGVSVTIESEAKAVSDFATQVTAFNAAGIATDIALIRAAVA